MQPQPGSDVHQAAMGMCPFVVSSIPWLLSKALLCSRAVMHFGGVAFRSLTGQVEPGAKNTLCTEAFPKANLVAVSQNSQSPHCSHSSSSLQTVVFLSGTSWLSAPQLLALKLQMLLQHLLGQSSCAFPIRIPVQIFLQETLQMQSGCCKAAP